MRSWSRWWWLSAIFGVILVCSSVFAQSPSGSVPVSSQFLARIERGQRSEDVCVLISRNGQYRLERLFPHKTDVFVGALSADQLRIFQQMLDQDSLVRLSPADIRNPLITDSFDLVQLDIFRTERLQHLSFRDDNSRKPFRESLKPLLSWFDQLRKLPNTQIPENNASHCMPAIPTGSDVKLVPPDGMGYFLGWSDHSFHRGQVERICGIIYTDGRYRLEDTIQKFEQPTSTRAFEASLTAAQIADLKKVLSSPELEGLKHDFDQARPAADLEVVRFIIPRETTIQRLSFGSYFNVLGNSRQVGGISNLQYGVEQDRKAIKPLQEWVKKNIKDSKGLVQTDTRLTDCIPLSSSN